MRDTFQVAFRWGGGLSQAVGRSEIELGGAHVEPAAVVSVEAREERRTPEVHAEDLQGFEAFARLAPEWDATLARGPVDQPFQRHAYLAAWLRAFAPGARLRVVAARDTAGRPLGFAPFLEERRGPLRVLRSPANAHSSRAEWALGEEPRAAVAAIWAHLRDRLRWDVLELRDVPRDGPTSRLAEAAARRDRHLTGRWASLRTPYLSLGARPREEALSSKFVANLRRRLRKLGDAGAVSYRRVGWRAGELARGEAGAAAAGLFEGFLALEAGGWKGRAGTAIARDPRALAFYRGLLEAGLREGWLALRALELDGRPVAAHFGLCHRGVYSLPKPAYDEALGACSPGQLLFREVLAECEAAGLAELDFLGPDMPWKRDWAPAWRDHDWLYVYRPGLVGAGLHLVKHRVKPLARRLLGARPRSTGRAEVGR